MRTLSSSWTWVLKYGYPCAFVLIMAGLALWLGLFHTQADTAAWGIGTALMTFVLVMQGRQFKRVRMDDDALYVSNFIREIRVPLSEMEHVSELVGMRQGNRVTITVRCDTPFGHRIVFVPHLSMGPKMDPIVRELKALIRKAEG